MLRCQREASATPLGQLYVRPAPDLGGGGAGVGGICHGRRACYGPGAPGNSIRKIVVMPVCSNVESPCSNIRAGPQKCHGSGVGGGVCLAYTDGDQATCVAVGDRPLPAVVSGTNLRGACDIQDGATTDKTFHRPAAGGVANGRIDAYQPAG